MAVDLRNPGKVIPAGSPPECWPYIQTDPETTRSSWHITDVQFSTMAMLDDNAKPYERVWYTPYGQARHHWGQDFDGDYDGTDDSTISGWAGASLPYRAYVDIDLDGDVDTADAGYTASDTMGWDVLSRDGSTIGYAGYVQDEYVPTVNHVRHRVLKTDLGRWMQRDPAGYVDGASLYEYVRSSPVGFVDPMGLAAEPCSGTWLPLRTWETFGDDLRHEVISGDGDVSQLVGYVLEELFRAKMEHEWDFYRQALVVYNKVKTYSSQRTAVFAVHEMEWRIKCNSSGRPFVETMTTRGSGGGIGGSAWRHWTARSVVAENRRFYENLVNPRNGLEYEVLHVEPAVSGAVAHKGTIRQIVITPSIPGFGASYTFDVAGDLGATFNPHMFGVFRWYCECYDRPFFINDK